MSSEATAHTLCFLQWLEAQPAGGHLVHHSSTLLPSCSFVTLQINTNQRRRPYFCLSFKAVLDTAIASNGPIGIGSLLEFYFRTPYSIQNPWISMSRFANVVSAAGGYSRSTCSGPAWAYYKKLK